MGGVPLTIKGKLKQMNSSLFHWGIVVATYPDTYTMDVKVVSEQGRVVKNIYINQSLSYSQGRAIFMPIPNITYVVIVKTDITTSGFIHLGYYLPEGDKSTNDRANTKTGTLFYQRYLNPGEFQVVSVAGTELYMPDNGDLFIKNSKGYFIKLCQAIDNLEIFVPDTKIQNYNVDISSGRVTRCITSLQGQIQRDASTEEPHYEFSINLGTLYDPTTALPIGVATGYMTLSDKVYDVVGDNPVAYEGAYNLLQFILEFMSGIRVSIDNSGDFYIVNSNNNSRFKIGTGTNGELDLTELQFKTKTSEFHSDSNNFSFIHKDLGYFLKFNIEDDGTASINARIGDNTIILDSTNGLQVCHQSGSGVVFGSDGSVIVNDQKSHTVVLNDDGITVNGAKEETTITGKIFTIGTDDGLVVGNSVQAIDGVLKAQPTALQFDTHIHKGPVGPPMVLWTPQLLTLLMAKGIKVG